MIATGTALALAAAGSIGTGIYNAKKTADTNKRALEASERSDTRAADLERERLAEERRRAEEDAAWRRDAYNAYLQADQSRWNDYMGVYGSRAGNAQGVLGNLAQLAGVSVGGQPPMAAGGGGGGVAPVVRAGQAGVMPMSLAALAAGGGPTAGRSAVARRVGGPSLVPQPSADTMAQIMSLAQLANLPQPGAPLAV